MPREIDVARTQAERLKARGIADGARGVLAAWRKTLAKERGDVPLELAAVLAWCAGGGDESNPWPIGPAAAERLGIYDGSSPHARVWAGLRIINEVGAALHGYYGELWPFADEDFWVAVVQARDIGVARWNAVLSAALAEVEDPQEQEPAAAVSDWAARATQAEIEQVTQTGAPRIVYRLGSAAKKVAAARILAGGVRPLRTAGFGRLLERPDLRKRIVGARAVGSTHIVGTLGLIAYQLGRQFIPALAPK